jgi:hydrogenase small subunit
MELGRREVLKASTAVAAALGLHATGLLSLRNALGLEAADGGVPVIWLQAQCCTGCSVSLLNSAYYTTIEDLAMSKLDIDYHPNLMAAAGSSAKEAALATYKAGGYVLVVEGAIPTADGGKACTLWPGLTALAGVKQFAARAKVVIAAGSCASYGGLVAGKPNPTKAQGLTTTITRTPIIKVPGCPVHPDWLVGTIAYLMANGKAPPLDSSGRPRDMFAGIIHKTCPFREGNEASRLGQGGCLEELGCKGPKTHCDCHVRKWNTTVKGQPGVNWCMNAGSPCIGCTEPGFPDQMSPFFNLGHGGSQGSDQFGHGEEDD